MKLSAIEKILLVATVGIVLFAELPNKNTTPPDKPVQIKPVQQTNPQTPLVPEITVAEAELQLQTLSNELDVRYDDMLEVTFYSCRSAGRSSLYFIPYVSINKQFKPNLGLQIFSVSNYPLFFDKLYIKTADNLYIFNLGARKSSYNELLRKDIYKSIKEAVDSGYLKFRITGNDIGERELTAGELEGVDAVLSIYEYFSKVKVAN